MRNEKVEDARRVLRADYWESVRSFAEDALRAVKDGEVSDEDGLMRYVEESIDGSSWLIYNGQILDVLRYTENDEAYEGMGDLADMIGTDGYWGMLTRIAYCAIRADILGMPEYEDAVEALAAKVDE